MRVNEKHSEENHCWDEKISAHHAKDEDSKDPGHDDDKCADEPNY
jgi:hypothetical protein